MPPANNRKKQACESLRLPHWSVVIAAGESGSEPAQVALEELCRSYWYPIYVYVRRKGYGRDEAEDLTQEFFAPTNRQRAPAARGPEQREVSDFFAGDAGLFPGAGMEPGASPETWGQFTFISIDEQLPEERYELEAADFETPERRFVRQWR
jgi:RNA polymerase sigma-70 factor (ECF subfamily)